MNLLHQELSDRVRGGLMRLGLPQSWLAARCGYTEKHISMVLTGQNKGSIDMWDKLIRTIEDAS